MGWLNPLGFHKNEISYWANRTNNVDTFTKKSQYLRTNKVYSFMRFFLWQKTTNKCDVLQKGTILGGGGVPKKV